MRCTPDLTCQSIIAVGVSVYRPPGSAPWQCVTVSILGEAQPERVVEHTLGLAGLEA
jgi:hypothetical protein